MCLFGMRLEATRHVCNTYIYLAYEYDCAIEGKDAAKAQVPRSSLFSRVLCFASLVSRLLETLLSFAVCSMTLNPQSPTLDSSTLRPFRRIGAFGGEKLRRRSCELPRLGAAKDDLHCSTYLFPN